jgi:hypothetical protein
VFGSLIALSVLYAYLASIFVLPSVLVVWARLVGDVPTGMLDDTDMNVRPAPRGTDE